MSDSTFFDLSKMEEPAKMLKMNWGNVSANNGPRYMLSGMSATVVGHVVYVLGGKHRNIDEGIYVHVIDSTKDFEWSTLKTAGEIPTYRWFHSSWLHKDKIYIYGGETIGQGGRISLSELLCFDVLLNSFIKVYTWGEELGSRAACTAGYIESLEVCVIFGGVHNVNESNRLRCLNMRSMHCSIPKIVGNGPLSLKYHGSCVVGTRIYMMGGETWYTNPSWMSMNILQCERVDRVRWSQPKATALSRSVPFRFSPTLTACGSRIFYLGGMSPHGHQETCYTFLADEGRWEKTEGAGVVPRQGGHVSFYANGVLYCYGGLVRVSSDTFLLRFPV